MYSHGKVQAVFKFLEHPFYFSINQNASKLLYRDLAGNATLLVLENTNIEQLLPTYNGAENFNVFGKISFSSIQTCDKHFIQLKRYMHFLNLYTTGLKIS